MSEERIRLELEVEQKENPFKVCLNAQGWMFHLTTLKWKVVYKRQWPFFWRRTKFFQVIYTFERETEEGRQMRLTSAGTKLMEERRRPLTVQKMKEYIAASEIKNQD